MDTPTFEAAFDAPYREPDRKTLIAVYEAAFERTGGDVASAMAAVNELLIEPVPFDVLMQRFKDAA
jgi:hypothetical protein